ncbi:MAG TPA: hypothetical protein VFV22_00465 [Candidatus Paceibacterota bacterium]|nr:hypothetical protein [Candidatus Paceibacterota bacterium]
MISRRKKTARSGGHKLTTANAFFWKQLLKGFGVVILCGAIGYGVHAFTSARYFTLDTIEVSGGQTISHERIRTDVQEILHGSYVGIIPRHFAYFYPQNDIVKYIERDTRVYNIVVEREGRKKLHIQFDEHVPYALWCVRDNTAKPCFYITSDGYTFSEAPQLHGGAFMRFYTDEANVVGQKVVLSKDVLAQLTTFAERVSRELGFQIISMDIQQNGDVLCTIAGGGSFYIASKRDVDETFANIRSVLTSDTYTHIKPGNFKYIDARFDKKLFVNEVIATSTVAQAEPHPDGEDIPHISTQSASVVNAAGTLKSPTSTGDIREYGDEDNGVSTSTQSASEATTSATLSE